MDVHGRPGMAPRAGFEVGLKFLSALEPWESDDRDTPSDTPMRNVLRCVALSRRLHAGDVAQFTATFDDMHRATRRAATDLIGAAQAAAQQGERRV